MAGPSISWINVIHFVIIIILNIQGTVTRRLLRSVDHQLYDNSSTTNSAEFIWSTATVAVGDTAVLHCSFDAIFQQQLLRSGNINWMKEATKVDPALLDKYVTLETVDGSAAWIASGKKIMLDDSRYRVYRPRNSALSVLIIRGCKKKDGGVYRCNLSGSSTRHKFMILNVTESKIEAQTSPATRRARIGSDVTLWCNATGYPKPVVYWTREDRNRRLPDGSYQFWGNGLSIKNAVEHETGIYSCFLDNFVQPIVSYKFSLFVEDNPWSLQGYKMRFNGKRWFGQESSEPLPTRDGSFLLMCEARGGTDPLPLIRWYRNGRKLRNGRHFHVIKNSVQYKPGYESSTLVIINFQNRFEGNYTCVASNIHRMKKLTFYLKEKYEVASAQTDQDLDNDEALLKKVSTVVKNQHKSYDGPSDDPPQLTISNSNPVQTRVSGLSPSQPISLSSKFGGVGERVIEAKGKGKQRLRNLNERFSNTRHHSDNDDDVDDDDVNDDDDESRRIWNQSNDEMDFDDENDVTLNNKRRLRYK